MLYELFLSFSIVDPKKTRDKAKSRIPSHFLPARSLGYVEQNLASEFCKFQEFRTLQSAINL